MTRAMLVTVLYRMDQAARATTGTAAKTGSSAVTGSAVTAAKPEADGFTDVKLSQWYTDAIAWANANGIAAGIGNGLFGTDSNVTREQLATILFNYARYKGYDASKAAELGTFADATAISGWARPAMKWANAQGLITGRTSDTLAAGGGTSRAEVATIL